jgi:hypothetical protein
LSEVAKVCFVAAQSQNLYLADWPLWRNATGSFGSIATIHHFQKLSFNTGVITSESMAWFASELVADFNRNGWLILVGIRRQVNFGEILSTPKLIFAGIYDLLEME